MGNCHSKDIGRSARKNGPVSKCPAFSRRCNCNASSPECSETQQGKLPGEDAVDLFYDDAELVRLAATRIDTPHTHGTGCTYSAAITAFLARGETLTDAVHLAKDFIARAIASAPGLGHGHGPVDHWA